MRYELNTNGYINKVFFGCYSGTCTLYKGTIPEGYSSLMNWADNANIMAYKIVNGNLTYDANKDAELQKEWNKNSNAFCYQPKEMYKITNGRITVGGSITASKSQIRFGIFTPKLLTNISSISVNNAKLAIRHVEGGYLVAEEDVTKYVIAEVNGDNAIYLRYEPSSAMSGVENNTPVSVEILELQLTFN